MLDLNEIRNNIDKIDSQLVELFEERMKLTTEVAEYKIETGKKVLDPAREKAKLESVKKLVRNPDNVHAIDDLFAQIMANSRKNQYMLLEKMVQTLREPYEAIDEINKKNCKVVYQGVPGAYSYAAMINFFGKDVDNFNVPTWRECMEAVKLGKADYAVLPIENSNAGIVADVYDLLQEYNNYIIAETYVKIEHLLLGLPGTDLENVTAVYSHPQGLMQCKKFLEGHQDWRRKTCSNTAISAKMVKEEEDKTQAAIASVEAGKIYGLEPIATCINQEAKNTTRFVVLSNKRRFLKSANKVSIEIETLNEKGALYNILSPIVYNDLNMMKLESRPLKGSEWNSRFYCDFEGNLADSRVRDALRGIYEESTSMRLLGNY